MIEILQTGIHTSIQDIGRHQFKNFGVPVSGALDQSAYLIANSLLNNSPKAAVLECCIKGPKLKFHDDFYICLTGAEMNARLNDKILKNYKPYFVKKEDVLSFGIAKSGCRTYLGISGGIKTEKVLGSRSQYKDITSSDKISKNTIIPIGKSNFKPAVGTRVKEQKINYANKKIEVYKGPEFKYLGKDQQNLIEKKIFQISSLNNRMAYQLKEKFTHSLPQIWTSPVIPGTVQCTPDGSLIILMRDSQITGGYPRLLQLTESSIQLISQKTTKSKIQFKILPKII